MDHYLSQNRLAHMTDWEIPSISDDRRHSLIALTLVLCDVEMTVAYIYSPAALSNASYHSLLTMEVAATPKKHI